MIPLKLTFKGLHSYRDESCIDFLRLTNAGLFGVFGPTGSGKSTILEAISLALYGDNDRMNRTGRGYNQLNLQSDELYIEFEFMIEQTGKRYRFGYGYKRNGRDFEKVQSPERRALELNGRDWQPIAPERVEEIIGLSYKNFKRTIIIPQGKFQEFLSLGGTERTAMMEELFDLQKYNLGEKTRYLAEQAKSEKTAVDAQLSLMEAITREFILEKEKGRQELKERIAVKSAEKEVMEAIILALGKLIVSRTDLNAILEQHAATEKKLLELKDKKKVLNEKSAEPWANEGKIQNQESEIIDLEKVVEWVKLLNEEKQLQAELQKFEKGIQQLSATKAKEEQVIQKLKEEIKEKKTELPEVGELKDAEIRLEKIGKLQTNLNGAIQKKLKAEKAFWDICSAQSKANDSQFDPATSLENQMEQLELLKNKSEKKKVEWTEILEQVEAQHSELSLNLRLDAWARELNPGQKCPLCGSVHHPDKFSASELTDAEPKLKAEIKFLRDQIKENDRTKEALIKAMAAAELELKSINVEVLNIGVLEAELKEENLAQQSSMYALANLDEIKAKLARAAAMSQEIKEKEAALEESEKSLKTSVERYDNGKGYVDKTRQKLDKVSGQIENQLLNIVNKSLVANPLPKEDLLEILANKQKLVSEWKENHRNWLEEKEAVDQDYDIFMGKKAALDDQIKAKKNVLREQEEGLLKLWQGNHADLEKLEVSAWRQNLNEDELSGLHEDWKVIKDRVGKEYIDAVYAEKFLEKEIQKLKEELISKEKLLVQEKQLHVRLENLELLQSLFRGRAFVEFMSHNNLKELCRLANLRFQKLNRNQLALEIDNKYEFIIRDIVNGGKTRNVSTLSGGQLFQASLCLALALSEQIRKSDHQQFFFIDEGFGSQDEHSLELIMQTLKDLKKEKRIVGLISHVEKMKEDIGIYLNIEHNGSDGSRVRGNWE